MILALEDLNRGEQSWERDWLYRFPAEPLTDLIGGPKTCV